MQIQISIVDYIALKLGIHYISDLPRMDTASRIDACRALEKVKAEDESLAGWNDALCYLVGEPPAESQVEARTRLIQKLKCA